LKSATVEELNLAHSKEYIELVDRQVSQLNNNRAYLSTGDTPISKDSNLVAKLAVGAGLEAVDQIMDGNLSSAFRASDGLQDIMHHPQWGWVFVFITALLLSQDTYKRNTV
jgi:acetoin utilization deacetylase AcuC-like enzyme